MIRAEITERGVMVTGALPPGTVAYVDRDWVPAATGPVPSLTVSADGILAWDEDSRAEMPDTVDADTAAALAFVSVAREAAAAVEDLPPGSTEVVGSGVIARLVRMLVDSGAATGAESPRGVVETTGDPAAILDATRRVADLGTVVLAGEGLGRRVEMNLYPDVHLRGLTLVGVAQPLQQGKPLAGGGDEDHLVRACKESLIRVGSGTLVPPRAAWYAVSG